MLWLLCVYYLHSVGHDCRLSDKTSFPSYLPTVFPLQKLHFRNPRRQETLTLLPASGPDMAKESPKTKNEGVVGFPYDGQTPSTLRSVGQVGDRTLDLPQRRHRMQSGRSTTELHALSCSGEWSGSFKTSQCGRPISSRGEAASYAICASIGRPSRCSNDYIAVIRY